MLPLTRSTDITSASDLRANLRLHLDRLAQTNRPLFITTNGEPEAILLSKEVFDKLVEQAEHMENLRRLQQGEADAQAGRTFPAESALRELAAKLGAK